MANNKSKKRRKSKGDLTAKTADKHVLYQRAVQDAEAENDFLDRTYRRLRGRKPKTLREDFCGTALLCSEWVSRGESRHATGVDLHGPTLKWGKKHNLKPLGDAAKRIELRQQNVLDPAGSGYDVICAFNFSYWIFKERDVMARYFKTVHDALGREGVFFLDSYGGWNAQETLVERRKVKGGFTYVWDQHEMNPIDSSVLNYIHFEFPDGTKMKRAFTYDWRLWTLREIQDLLLEAGFSSAHIYWEDEDEDGEGNGVYRKRTVVENDPGWLAYIVALR